MALTRFHFVAGMPHAGARHLLRLLAQNPRFSATQDGPAAQIFAQLHEAMADRGAPLGDLDTGTRTALLRGALDAAHHARPMDSVVLDHNDGWLDHLEPLAQLMPLSRFIIMVRDPSAIAAAMAEDSGAARSPTALLAPNGPIGAPMAQIEAAMAAPLSERLLLIDYDRLLADPDRVLAALYSVLREPLFAHDTRALPTPDAAPAQLRAPKRRVISLSARMSRPPAKPVVPLWHRSSGTAATLLLREAG